MTRIQFQPLLSCLVQVCYTFDAGPNACLYLLKSNVRDVLGLVRHFFPPVQNGEEFIRGITKEVPEVSEVINTVAFDGKRYAGISPFNDITNCVAINKC